MSDDPNAFLMGTQPDVLSPDLQELAEEVKHGDLHGEERHCPAHDDHNPSLVITHVDDRTLIKCRAGCKPQEIVKAVGLTMADLFRDADGPGEPPAWAADPYPKLKTYSYVDENRTPLFTTHRTPGKSFPVMAADGTSGLNGTRRVLYRLPEVIAAVAAGGEIHVAEGEKDADALTLAGVTATTNLGGAASWKDSDADTLKGASMVTVWQDRDEAGRKRAVHVGETLAARGIPYRVVMGRVEAEKADAYDHLAAGWKVADAVPVEAAPEGLGPWATDEFRQWLAVPEHAKAVQVEEDRRMVRRIADAKDAGKRSVPVMTADEALDAILNGFKVSVPSVAKIEDHPNGRGLFYSGFINGIFGDQSVGKSVMLAEIQARTLRNGGTVVHWEFDNNNPPTIVQRLLHAGLGPEQIRGKFKILNSPGDRDALSPEFRSTVSLVTLDSLNPACTFFKVDPYHPSGVDTVLQECMTSFVLHGACGCFLDHVGHENKQRQTGSIRKSQAVQGALYEAVKVQSLKPGMTGRTSLILRKDNRGSLGMEDVTTAVAVMRSAVEPGADAGPVSAVFEAPDPFKGETVEFLETPEQRVRALLDAQGDKTIGRPRVRQLMEDKGIEMGDRRLKVLLHDWKEEHLDHQAGPLGPL
jgi:hypothetical protein